MPQPHYAGNQILKFQHYPKINLANKRKQKRKPPASLRLPNISTMARPNKAGSRSRVPYNNIQYMRPPPKLGGISRSRFKDLLKDYDGKKMCGICGTMHAPGESHKLRSAAKFNQKTGASQLSMQNKTMGAPLFPAPGMTAVRTRQPTEPSER